MGFDGHFAGAADVRLGVTTGPGAVKSRCPLL
jgi:hypothetical protein